MHGFATRMVLLATALVTFVLVLNAGQALATHVGCGDIITQNTTLDSDLIDCPRHGIVIGADNITLDLNGHTIDGDDSLFEPCPVDEPCDAGIANSGIRDGVPVNGEGFSGVTIKNGFVRDFPEEGVFITHTSANRVTDIDVAAPNSSSERAGVILLDCSGCRVDRSSTSRQSGGIVVESSRDVEVANNNMHDNEFLGLIVLRSQDVRVTGNAVSDNGDGIVLVDASDNNVVANNSVARDGAGVVIESSSNNEVRENSLHDNFFVGVVVVAGDDNRITGNSIFRNGDGFEGGIHVASNDRGDGSHRTVVSANTLGQNRGDGILVDRGQIGTVIDGNRSDRNSDDGIDVDHPATTLRKNTANKNGDLGVEAVAGVKDGGGNTARGNGNPLQCLNVECK